MRFVALVLFMLSLMPSRGTKDVTFRVYIAQAIVHATLDEEEELTLSRLAKTEGSYLPDVASCKKIGAQGELGLFQVKPRSSADRKAACGTLKEQAILAVRILREAVTKCPKNTGAAKLNLYTSGRCDWGYEASKKRWGGQDLNVVYFSPVPAANDNGEEEQSDVQAAN